MSAHRSPLSDEPVPDVTVSDVTVPDVTVPRRRPYARPRLTAHGRLAELTRTLGNNGASDKGSSMAMFMMTGL